MPDNDIEAVSVCNIDEEGRFGGPEHRIIQVAKEVSHYNVKTHIVFPILDAGRFQKEAELAGVTYSQLPLTRLSKERRILGRYVRRFFTEIRLLKKFFAGHKFNLVHVNGAYQFKSAIAAWAAGIPVVWHLNNTKVDRAVKAIFYIVSRFAAKGFIVAGQRVYDYYLVDHRLSGLPVREIHAPVDFNKFDPENCGSVSVDAPIRIVSVAGINPVKGIEFLVELATRIARSYPEVEIIAAGAMLSSQVDYAAMIKQKIADCGLQAHQFQMPGLVDNIPALLCSADVCVFTSINEASPTAVWEAMAMAKPIVTTDVGSVSQYLVDGESGFIVPPGDVDGLFRGTVELIKDAHIRERMGKAAYAMAKQKLGVERAAQLHNEIYRLTLYHGSH